MTTSELRVSLGGSWLFRPRNLRSAVRGNNTPSLRNRTIGLRLALLDTEYRALRGGPWGSLSGRLRSAARQTMVSPSHRINNVGLRLALENTL